MSNECNGWTNWETWTLAMELSNHDYTVREMIDRLDHDEPITAEDFEIYFEEVTESVFQCNRCRSKVDWNQLASAWQIDRENGQFDED